MGTSLSYEQVIKNDYLGETKVIRGRDPVDLRARVETQLNKWAEKEQKLREKERAQKDRAAAERQAEEATREAQEALAALERLLVDSLDADHGVEWEALKDRREYPHFSYGVPRPTAPPPLNSPRLADYHSSMGVPRRSFFEVVLPWLRRAREDAERRAKREWENALHQIGEQSKRQAEEYAAAEEHWKRQYAVAQQRHAKERIAFEERREAQHGVIEAQRAAYMKADPKAIAWCAERVLAASELPAVLTRDFEVAFDPHSETVVISHTLPTMDDLPSASEYRYVLSRKEIAKKEIKEKDRAALFGRVVDQLALRTVHEVFAGCADCAAVQSVVFNGWADGVDPKTGNPFHSCIISCQVSREQYAALNLHQVDPHECLRSLAALSAGPLHELAPVRPILELDRADSRFVESREVLDAVDTQGQNLATMEWEDFEHLVRELFSRVFAADGCEVNVTQASRDQGVDAIAFDPDPVRGGKFVIQAKRYNNVVGVEAVRDLYGTLINEGAVKGILVTTAYYGREAREFAKDKPLTLIDGANLVHMLREHGYESVFIETKRKQNA